MVTKKPESSALVYPYAPIQLCLPIAEAVKTLGGRQAPVSKSLLADHLKEDEKSQGLAFKITSAKCFGLIEGRSDFLLTETSKRHFFPTNQTESGQALLTALNTPPAFQVLIKRFDGSVLPPETIMGNILHTDANVAESWKDRVAGFFVRSAQHVGVIDAGGHLRFNATQLTPLAKSAPLPEGGDMELSDAAIIAPSAVTSSSGTVAPAEGKAVNTWSFTHQGKTVRVETPAEISAELWKKLSGYISLLAPSTETKKEKK